MKFLIDQCLSPRLAERLNERGHDAVHASDVELQAAPDTEILSSARDTNRVVVTADSDFGTLLASTRAERPSILYIRRVDGRRIESLLAVVEGNLSGVERALAEGSIVVIGESTVRVRRLPIL